MKYEYDATNTMILESMCGTNRDAIIFYLMQSDDDTIVGSFSLREKERKKEK